MELIESLTNNKCGCNNCDNKKGNVFTLPVSQETCDYLQRLGMGIDARLAVIDRIMTIHANDTNDSVLESKPFKKYHAEFEELNAEYTQAKLEFEKELKPIVFEKVGKEVDFNWLIKDFLSQEVEITIL